jgi:hypothetical protein
VRGDEAWIGSSASHRRSDAARVGPGIAAGFTLTLTHTVDLKVIISDHWTRTTDPGACGVNGSGAVQATLGWRRPVKARPEIEPAAHRWTLLVLGPGGGSVLDLAPQRIGGTIRYTNQVSESSGDGCTGSVSGRGCRTYPAVGTTNVFGIDRRSLRVLSPLLIGSQIRPRGSCLIGAFVQLNQGDFFNRDLSIRMPAPAVLRRKRTVVVRGSESGHIRNDTLESGTTIVETVTESAIVTFKRIGR